MALFLFIDTCTPEALIGLGDGTGKPLTRKQTDARRLGESLHLEIATLLQDAGKTLHDLEAVALVNGPGSYTGLRMGLAAAKGLCYALEIPLIALGRLPLLLEQFRDDFQVEGSAAVLIPARPGEWFAMATDEAGNVLLEPGHIVEAAWQEALRNWQRTGPVSVAVASGVGSEQDRGDYLAFIKNVLDGATVAKATEKAFLQGRFADLVLITPFYLKSVYIIS